MAFDVLPGPGWGPGLWKRGMSAIFVFSPGKTLLTLQILTFICPQHIKSTGHGCHQLQLETKAHTWVWLYRHASLARARSDDLGPRGGRQHSCSEMFLTMAPKMFSQKSSVGASEIVLKFKNTFRCRGCQGPWAQRPEFQQAATFVLLITNITVSPQACRAWMLYSHRSTVIRGQ